MDAGSLATEGHDQLRPGEFDGNIVSSGGSPEAGTPGMHAVLPQIHPIRASVQTAGREEVSTIPPLPPPRTLRANTRAFAQTTLVFANLPLDETQGEGAAAEINPQIPVGAVAEHVAAPNSRSTLGRGVSQRSPGYKAALARSLSRADRSASPLSPHCRRCSSPLGPTSSTTQHPSKRAPNATRLS